MREVIRRVTGVKNTKRFLKTKQYLAYLRRPVFRWRVDWYEWRV
jgi:hypothetical protein